MRLCRHRLPPPVPMATVGYLRDTHVGTRTPAPHSHSRKGAGDGGGAWPATATAPSAPSPPRRAVPMATGLRQHLCGSRPASAPSPAATPRRSPGCPPRGPAACGPATALQRKGCWRRGTRPGPQPPSRGLNVRAAGSVG